MKRNRQHTKSAEAPNGHRDSRVANGTTIRKQSVEDARTQPPLDEIHDTTDYAQTSDGQHNSVNPLPRLLTYISATDSSEGVSGQSKDAFSEEVSAQSISPSSGIIKQAANPDIPMADDKTTKLFSTTVSELGDITFSSMASEQSSASLSDLPPQQPLESFSAMIIETSTALAPIVIPGESEERRQQPAAPEPPVTKSMLSELDVSKIIHNPRLRHDINYDPDLHFRPNVEGERGRKKHHKASLFWKTMKEQLNQFLFQTEAFEAEFGSTAWTLPATLRAIRGILETLIPERDRASVEEMFDIEMLMQQFRMKVIDMRRLSQWLATLLKGHCAPMRDQWIDAMVEQLTNGGQTSDVELMVSGLCNCLGVLEAMKLDVANHQIRCLRPVLIEDTVYFKQKYFRKKVLSGKMNLAEDRQWYRKASVLPDIVPLDPSLKLDEGMWALFKGLVDLVTPLKPVNTLATFSFDEDRLHKLRIEILDMINLEICMYFFHALQIKCSRVQEFQAAAARQPQPTSADVRASIISILSCSNDAQKWEHLTPDLALQILRSTTAPMSRLAEFEEQFTAHISKPQSCIYQEASMRVFTQLFTLLQKVVASLVPLTAVQLHEVVAASRIIPGPLIPGGSSVPVSKNVQAQRDNATDLAMRIAHVGILHWRVWATMAYLPEVDTDYTIAENKAKHRKSLDGTICQETSMATF